MKELEIEKTGDLKQDIIQLAELMFRIYGYDATTFQKIADRLGITKGAITYHFKNKHLIVDQLLDTYFRQLREHIHSKPEEYRNKYWYFCVMYIYAYRTIMRDSRNQEIFYHKHQMGLWSTLKVDRIKEIYKEICLDFHKPFSEEELLMNTYIDLGARNRLYQEFKNGNNEFLTIDKYCLYHIRLLGALCFLDQATMEENIEAAYQFADAYSPPSIPLFY